MSRIGKSPIPLAQGVEISIANGLVTVKGPKGTLTQEIDNSVNIEVKENTVVGANSLILKNCKKNVFF